MFTKETTVVPLPLGEFNQMKEDIRFLRREYESNRKTQPPNIPEWIPRKAFMSTCNIGSTTFNILKNQGKLDLNTINRKVFVHRSCVDKYFSGAITTK